jgi:transposase-like protein
MAMVHVQGPYGQRLDVVKYGKPATRTQRYRYNKPAWARRSLLLQDHDTERWPAITRQIVDMTRHGRGVRDIVRGLGVSATTVIETLTKGVNPPARQ